MGWLTRSRLNTVVPVLREEVHQVPHKHVKGAAGIAKDTMGDMVIETTRPGPARRRTPLTVTIVDDDSVEETGEEDSDEELQWTEGGTTAM